MNKKKRFCKELVVLGMMAGGVGAAEAPRLIVPFPNPPHRA